MQHAIFACINTLAVGLNLGVIIVGGNYDPTAGAIGITVCSVLAIWELSKLGKLRSPL